MSVRFLDLSQSIATYMYIFDLLHGLLGYGKYISPSSTVTFLAPRLNIEPDQNIDVEK